MQYGLKLRNYREAAGLSLRQLAKELSISHVYIGQVERGVKPALNKEHWLAVSSAIPSFTVAEQRALSLAEAPVLAQHHQGATREFVAELARTLHDEGLDDSKAKSLLALLSRRD